MKTPKSLIIIFKIILLIVISSGSTLAEETKAEIDGYLTLNKCIELAINNNPNIKVATNKSKAQQSKIGQAKSSYFPQVNLSGDYALSSRGNVLQINSQFGEVTGTSSNMTNVFSGAVSLNQLVYDFGKTPTQVRIQKLNYNSSEAELENEIINIIYSVKQAYYNVIKAQHTKEVYQKIIDQYELHLKQAEAFYKVGTKSRIDITGAQVNLSNAKLSYIKASNDYKLSIANLNNTMGTPEIPEYQLMDKREYQKLELKQEEAINKAYENRPDLYSLAVLTLSAEKALSLAKKGYYPVLSSFADYGIMNRGTKGKQNWSIGMVAKVPIFNGFLTRNQVKEARANLEVAKSNEEVMKQKMFLEVQQAYINVKTAEEIIPANEIIVRQAKENLDIAKGRYKVGVGSYIEVQDALNSYNNAELSYVKALYDYKISISNLEKTMGER